MTRIECYNATSKLSLGATRKLIRILKNQLLLKEDAWIQDLLSTLQEGTLNYREEKL